jgi:hypothetical protein
MFFFETIRATTMTAMPYFDDALEDETFNDMGSSLLSRIDVAEPRLRSMPEVRSSAPREEGKWSPKQILGHLIDSVANNHQRFVRAQEGSPLRLPEYAPDHWVAAQHYDERSWEDLGGLWSAYNRHLAQVVARIPETLRTISCEIGGNPPVSLSYLALDYVSHLDHHLRQIDVDPSN